MFVHSNLGFDRNHVIRKFFRSKGCDPVRDTVGGYLMFLGIGLMFAGMFRLMFHPDFGVDVTGENHWCGVVVMSMMLPGAILTVMGVVLFRDFKAQVNDLAKHLGFELEDLRSLNSPHYASLREHAHARLVSIASQVKSVEWATEGVPYHPERLRYKQLFEEHYYYFEQVGLASGGFGEYFRA